LLLKEERGAKTLLKSKDKYNQDQIIQMLDCLIDKIFFQVWWTNVSTDDWYSKVYKLCSTIRWAYGADFLQMLPRNKDRKITQTFNSSISYIDVLSLNNSRFGDYLHLICFLPWLSHWNRQRKKIKTKLYDKRDDFIFPIVSISSIYQQHISQLIRYSRSRFKCSDLLKRA
jgi:hypothetical protein